MRSLPQDWYALLSHRAASKRGSKLFLIVLALLVLGLNLYAPAPLTIAERILASAIILLNFGIIWHWTYRGSGDAETGFLPTMLVVYFLEFSFAIFTQKALLMNFDFATYYLDEAAVVKALILTLVGISLIVCGFYGPWRHAIDKVLPKFEMHWRDENAVQLTSLIFIIVGLLMFAVFWDIKLSERVQAYVSLPSDFFYLSMSALFILQLEGKLNFILKLLLWGLLIPARLFLGIAQGQLGLGMFIVVALILTYATMRRRVPWAVFLLGFGAFVVLQPVKSSFRQLTWQNNQMAKEVGQGDKAAALLAATERGWTFVEAFDPVDVVSIATSRLGDILVFATLVQWTPRDIPYWGGWTYYKFLFIPIPRFIYPEKPDYMEGNIFGHQYAMIDLDNFTTSINIPQITEFYGNFGPIGVVLGCLLLGILYRSINDSFIHEKCGFGAIVAGIYFLTHLVDIENALAPILGGLLIEAVTVAIFHGGIRLTESVLKIRRMKHSMGLGLFEPEAVGTERRKSGAALSRSS
jgi:hypothetical protein